MKQLDTKFVEDFQDQVLKVIHQIKAAQKTVGASAAVQGPPTYVSYVPNFLLTATVFLEQRMIFCNPQFSTGFSQQGA